MRPHGRRSHYRAFEAQTTDLEAKFEGLEKVIRPLVKACQTERKKQEHLVRKRAKSHCALFGFSYAIPYLFPTTCTCADGPASIC